MHETQFSNYSTQVLNLFPVISIEGPEKIVKYEFSDPINENEWGKSALIKLQPLSSFGILPNAQLEDCVLDLAGPDSPFKILQKHLEEINASDSEKIAVQKALFTLLELSEKAMRKTQFGDPEDIPIGIFSRFSEADYQNNKYLTRTDGRILTRLLGQSF